MALATQCPFCQTTFRVANDQLKLRGGLVRCGHCNEVFDGNAHLLPEQQGGGNWPMLPPAAPPPLITPAIARANAAAPNYGAPPADEPPDPEKMAEILAAWDTPPSAGDFSPHDPFADTDAPTADVDERAIDAADFNAASLPRRPSAAWHDEEPRPDAPAHRPGEPGAEPAHEDDAREADPDADTDAAPDVDIDVDAVPDADDAIGQPEFVRVAQRRQRWIRARRALTAVCCVLLACAALAQGVYLGRNRIAAALPSVQPLLAAACLPLHCTVGLQRQIDQLSIESNELQAAEPGQPALTLSLLLRNRSDTALAWPDIELTLNDNDEVPLIRRVFTPADYLPSAATIHAGIAPDSEQPVKLSFTLTQGAASGYRVYLFYP